MRRFPSQLIVLSLALTLALVACGADDTPGGGGGGDASTTDGGVDSASGGGDTTAADAAADAADGSGDAGASDAAPDDAGASDTAGGDASASDAAVSDGTSSDTTDPVDAGADVGTDSGGAFKPGCCSATADCGGGGVCVADPSGGQGQCKDTAELKSGECWSDAGCASGKCVGASVCGCGQSCLVPDKAGKCEAVSKACSVNPIGVNVPCTDSGDYCKLDSGCEGKGVCTPKPVNCAGIFDEHCGCDGQSYSNACAAAAKGQNVASKGACSAGKTCDKVDPKSYGACDMLLGYGWDGSQCVAVSGCSCGGDCDKLHKDKAACTKACAAP